MTIRPALAKDEENIYALMCELEEEPLDRALFALTYLKHLQNPDYEIMVCQTGDDNNNSSISGMIEIRFDIPIFRAERAAEITALITAPDCRNQNIGSRLFDWAETRARNCGCSLLWLCTNQKRKDAHRFYENHGMSNTHYKFVKQLQKPGR